MLVSAWSGRCRSALVCVVMLSRVRWSMPNGQRREPFDPSACGSKHLSRKLSDLTSFFFCLVSCRCVHPLRLLCDGRWASRPNSVSLGPRPCVEWIAKHAPRRILARDCRARSRTLAGATLLLRLISVASCRAHVGSISLLHHLCHPGHQVLTLISRGQRTNASTLVLCFSLHGPYYTPSQLLLRSRLVCTAKDPLPRFFLAPVGMCATVRVLYYFEHTRL